MDFSEFFINENQLEKYYNNYLISSRNFAETLVKKMSKTGLTLSAAESCTGGLVGALITDVPGASSVYSGGMITYNNNAKISVLGVNSSTVEKYTEVSFQTAHEMAVCVKNKFNSQIGASVTGYAGPSGGTESDPLGTVYVGVEGLNLSAVYRLFMGKNKSREQIRYVTACFLFDLLSSSGMSC